MKLPEQSVELANSRLEQAGFSQKSLSDLDMPAVEHIDYGGDRNQVAYQVHGDVGAPNVIVESTTFFTYLRNPHETLRQQVKQTALGPDYAIVAVDSYDPSVKFGRHERKQLANGSFAPLSARELVVLDHLGLSDDQKLLSYGYSMAADVSLQLAHDTHFDPNRGIHKVEAVGALEMARSSNRGIVRVIGAMASSGKALVDNIMDSQMPALEEAWGVDNPAKAKKAINGRANLSVLDYLWTGPINNLDMGFGFGTDESTKQAIELINGTNIPVLLGRELRSTVCGPEVFKRIISETDRIQDVDYLVEDNDHSADDNLRLSAARIIYFTSKAAF